MPSILAYMNEGGFAAYVAASRATCCDGLYVAHPITLEQLNQDLPVDLVREMQKFNAMAWNTLVRYGFREGNIIPVEDTADDPYLIVDKPRAVVETAVGDSILKPNKSEGRLDISSKWCRQQNMDANLVFRSLKQYGCMWSQQDWSCAYDTVITSFLYVYLSLSDDKKCSFANGTMLMRAFVRTFNRIDLADIKISADLVNAIRDQMQDLLSAAVPAMFP